MNKRMINSILQFLDHFSANVHPDLTGSLSTLAEISTMDELPDPVHPMFRVENKIGQITQTKGRIAGTRVRFSFFQNDSIDFILIQDETFFYFAIQSPQPITLEFVQPSGFNLWENQHWLLSERTKQIAAALICGTNQSIGEDNKNQTLLRPLRQILKNSMLGNPIRFLRSVNQNLILRIDQIWFELAYPAQNKIENLDLFYSAISKNGFVPLTTLLKMTGLDSCPDFSSLNDQVQQSWNILGNPINQLVLRKKILDEPEWFLGFCLLADFLNFHWFAQAEQFLSAVPESNSVSKFYHLIQAWLRVARGVNFNNKYYFRIPDREERIQGLATPEISVLWQSFSPKRRMMRIDIPGLSFSSSDYYHAEIDPSHKTLILRKNELATPNPIRIKAEGWEITLDLDQPGLEIMLNDSRLKFLVKHYRLQITTKMTVHAVLEINDLLFDLVQGQSRRVVDLKTRDCDFTIKAYNHWGKLYPEESRGERPRFNISGRDRKGLIPHQFILKMAGQQKKTVVSDDQGWAFPDFDVSAGMIITARHAQQKLIPALVAQPAILEKIINLPALMIPLKLYVIVIPGQGKPSAGEIRQLFYSRFFVSPFVAEARPENMDMNCIYLEIAKDDGNNKVEIQEARHRSGQVYYQVSYKFLADFLNRNSINEPTII